eukprot:CAMPEP_0178445340 /NCGR_PEP_ID=MMETSP0689_2-20121128/40087_1 /TAXON_ID=160604 /ORGANISM="Amphidinium massartii, Strain CS-259" /LENGTH=102 /DNA_ID=CAMNT_0020069829 /DNA_START=60 /DNA_END=365 /DNA_ORIENTATION=-
MTVTLPAPSHSRPAAGAAICAAPRIGVVGTASWLTAADCLTGVPLAPNCCFKGEEAPTCFAGEAPNCFSGEAPVDFVGDVAWDSSFVEDWALPSLSAVSHIW